MKAVALLTLVPLALCASACTTVPSPSEGFLSRSDGFDKAKGVRGKRLATQPPSPPIELNSKLRLLPVRFTTTAQVSEQITSAERSLIENALARDACKAFSRHFEVVGENTNDESAYQLRIGISQLAATSKVGAAVGIATGFVVPIGVRPPAGLGALTVEFELLRPNGNQAAAMVWSRKADVLASGTAKSRIGDAYLFAGDAASDFAKLASTQTDTKTKKSGIGKAIRNTFAKADEVCADYGKGASLAAQAVSLLGLPLPPENIDKGKRQ